MIRKIISRKEAERLQARKMKIITIVLGAILLLSTIGYAFMSFEKENKNNEKISFNGIEFIRNENGFWGFSYGGNSYETLFNPFDTLNITGKITRRINDYYDKPLYFGINSMADAANNGNYELARNMQKIIAKSQFSCLSENCTEDYPIKNCSSDNIMIFKQIEGNVSRISEKENCVTLSYSLGDEEKASDAFIFRILGIQ
jgi:hypothetical protein